jgi:hypothetical protein
VRSAPRWCPHLDHDLAEGHVDGDELVCPGHAWAFDGDGHAYKRNEFGRVDPKGTVRRSRSARTAGPLPSPCADAPNGAAARPFGTVPVP